MSRAAMIAALRRDLTEARAALTASQRAFATSLEFAQRKADEEIAELRATLANEQGWGAPPSEGWAPLGGGVENVRWRKTGASTAHVGTYDTGPGWHWTLVREGAGATAQGEAPTARAAMKAADAALRGDA